MPSPQLNDPSCVTQQSDADKKVWFISGAGRGMGVDIAKAAMARGNAVVATARNTDTVSSARGQNEDVLAVKLDVTDPTDAQVSVRAAMDRFGHIDVLVNNAGNFYAGFFEEISPENFRAQIEATIRSDERHASGASYHARSALWPRRRHLLDRRERGPGVLLGVCRLQVRDGGLDRVAGPRVAPFNIHTMLVEPGFFRTELLSPESTRYTQSSIDDYAERTEKTVAALLPLEPPPESCSARHVG